MLMKKIIYFVLPLILLAFLLNSCQPKVDTEKEKPAIKAQIDAETQAWIDKDGAKFADLYIHDEDQTRATLTDTAILVQVGWSKFGNMADSVKMPIGARSRIQNFIMTFITTRSWEM